MSASVALELIDQSVKDLEYTQRVLHQMSQPPAVSSPVDSPLQKETSVEVPVFPATVGMDCRPSSCNVEKMSRVRKGVMAAMLIMANFVAVFPFGAGITGGLSIGKSLGAQGPSQASWIPASYSLTQGAFVLMTGRLGAVFGHRKILLLGATWWIIWTFINSVCDNFVAFNVARGLSGIGGAMVVPNAVALIGSTYPPGRTRNLCLGLFGAGAPMGGWAGALASGLFVQLTPWKWLFIFMAILGVIVFGGLWSVLPPEDTVNDEERMDWIGSSLGIGGLIIFNFVWNQAPMAGWSSPYEIILLVVSVLLFVAFGFWEYKYAAQPIMPLRIWIAPSFFPLIIVVLLTFMAYGTFLWYMLAWQQEIRHWTLLSLAAGLSPLPICAASAALLAAWLIPRVAAQWILAIGCLTILIAQILIATMPEQQTYWAQVFPATIFQSFCPDFIFTAAQIIACNSVQRHEQGIAGSLIGTLQLYATSLGLGFAGIVERHTDKQGLKPVDGYRAALYFGMGTAVAALLIGGIFIRMPKDTREGWRDGDGGGQGEKVDGDGVVTA